MNFLKNYRNPLIVLGLLIVLFYGYKTFFVGEDSDPSGLTSVKTANGESALITSQNQIAARGRESVRALRRIEQINFNNDKSVLNDDRFLRLKDNTVPVLTFDLPGRGNPFASIGDESTPLDRVPEFSFSTSEEENIPTQTQNGSGATSGGQSDEFDLQAPDLSDLDLPADF